MSRGIHHSNAKLTEENVYYIRKMKGVVPYIKLAKEFSVHPSTIHDIMNGVTWKHLLNNPNPNRTRKRPAPHTGAHRIYTTPIKGVWREQCIYCKKIDNDGKLNETICVPITSNTVQSSNQEEKTSI